MKAAVAGSAVPFLAGCLGANGDDEDDDTGGVEIEDNWLTYGLPEPPNSVHPFLSQGVYGVLASDFIYDRGAVNDPETSEVRPWVFTDWEMQEPESANPEVVFNAGNINDLVFNDGVDATLDDIHFSYQYLLDHEPAQVLTWSFMESIEWDDGDWDFRIVMDDQYGVWDNVLFTDAPIIPEHVWSEVGADYDGYNVNDNADYREDGETGPVGTGSAVIDSWQPDTSFSVSFREDYGYPLYNQSWIEEHDLLEEGGPHLDEIRFFVYGDTSAMSQEFLRGEVHTMYELPSGDINTVLDDDQWRTLQGPDSGFSYVGWNLTREPFNDITLRQAMMFCWDDIHWVEGINSGHVIDGDVSMPPGYEALRPDFVFADDWDRDVEISADPAMNAFQFRAEEEDSPNPDVEGIREFLTNGEVIDGTSGTYVGVEYPGSLSGVQASQTEPVHDYSFGEAQAGGLAGISDEELYVNGEPLSELLGGRSIEILLRPPGENPDIGEIFFRWAESMQQVGIPVEIVPTAFSEITGSVPHDPEFDMFELGWGGWASDGSSVHDTYISQTSWPFIDRADNRFGYGIPDGDTPDAPVNVSADDMLQDAISEMDPDERSQKFATVLERIYLDAPAMVYNFDISYFPLLKQFSGGYDGVTEPNAETFLFQAANLQLE